MTVEQIPVAPQALDLSFLDRVEAHVTSVQLTRLAGNLAVEGIVGMNERLTRWQFMRLGRNVAEQGTLIQLGDNSTRQPWTEFMRVNDAVTFADAEPQPDAPPKYTRLTVQFDSGSGRDRFHDLYESLLAGIHGPTIPRVRSGGPRELSVSNFSHPDVCTAGRVGTALFGREFAHLGRNNRLILQHNLDQIDRSGVTQHMPNELRERMAEQRERLGAAAGGTLLTSGQLSLVGSAVRRALSNTGELEMQRRRGNRPAIENGLVFRRRASSDDVGLPVSGTTVGQQLQGQIVERIADLHKKGDPIGTAERLWGMLSGLGINEGVGSAVKALYTVTTALSAAATSAIADARTRRRQR